MSSRAQRSWQFLAGLAGLAAGLMWCWWQIRQLGDVRLHLGTFYRYFGVAFALYLLALWLVQRWEQRRPPSASDWYPLSLIALAALLARVVMLSSPPTLSRDIVRYQWDGRVQRAGFDPYAYAPDDPALVPLRDPSFAEITFPHLRTVYPPMTELVFRLGDALGGSIMTYKMLAICAEFLTVIALCVLLHRRRRSRLWLLAYAWHPLAILEIAGSGHNDALGIAALWLGIAAWEARVWVGATAGWLAAFLCKCLSIILVPWWYCRRAARGWLVAFLVLALAPFVIHPTLPAALLGSLSSMTTIRAASNASGYLALAWLTGHSRLTILLAVGMWGGWLIWWAQRQADPARYVLGAFLVMALLSPALHPWYVVWLIPCLCFWRVGAVLALTGTVVLSYLEWPEYLAHGVWTIPLWAHVLEYLPVVLLGCWDLRRCMWPSSFPLATKPSLSGKP